MRGGKLRDPRADHRKPLAGFAVHIVMAAISDAQSVKGLGQSAQMPGHLAFALRGIADGGVMRLGAAAQFARPEREILGRAAGDFQRLIQVIVEDHIIHVIALHGRDQPAAVVDQMRLGAQLHADIGQGARAVVAHRLQHRLGMVGATVTAFPAPALREPGGGDAIRRRLAVGAGDAVNQRKRGGGAGRDMPLKRVAMQVDHAGHQVIAAQIHRRKRPFGDPALGQGQ